MKFNIDGKEYDSEKLSNNGKVCLARLQHIKSKKDQLSVEFGEMDILDKHYVEQLKKELSKEEEKVKANVM
jgi:hypothetical protein